jgi:hypothetical protein
MGGFYFIMEENKLKVIVEVDIKDGNYLFDISATKSLSIEEIRSILAGGVCLTIHGEETPKDQARVLKEVIDHMEQDFIDIDSFKDVYVKPPKEKE